MQSNQTVLRTERDPMSGVLLGEMLIERIVVDGHEKQTTLRETRYNDDGTIAYADRPVAADRARVIIAEAEADGHLG